jgi:hypothetical protein
LRQNLLADAGRGDLLKTIIDRVELHPNGLRMILSLVPLTPAAAPPDRLQGCVFTREFPLRIKRRGVEMRFAIDARDPRATNPDTVLLKEIKRARRCFDALVGGSIGSVADPGSLEGISDRYEAVVSVHYQIGTSSMGDGRTADPRTNATHPSRRGKPMSRCRPTCSANGEDC